MKNRSQKKAAGNAPAARNERGTGEETSLLHQVNAAAQAQVMMHGGVAGHVDALGDDRAVDVAGADHRDRALRSIDVGEESGGGGVRGPGGRGGGGGGRHNLEVLWP